jgi:hypothetical protein
MFQSFGSSGRVQHYDEMGEQMAFVMAADISGGIGVFQGAAGMISYQGVCALGPNTEQWGHADAASAAPGYGTAGFSKYTAYVSLVSSKALGTSTTPGPTPPA